MRWIVLVVTTALLSVPAGQAAKPREAFRFQASAPAALKAGTPAVVVRVKASAPAEMTVTLYRSSQKLQTWHPDLAAGQRRLRLALTPGSRRVGSYKLLLAASSGEETVFRTIRFRIVAPLPG